VKSGELKEGVVAYTEESVTDAGVRAARLKLVPKGSLLVAMYGATVGRTALLGVDATTNQAVCHVRPDPARADTRYVWFALQAKLPELLARRVGGAQPNISQETIRTTKIRLPSLPEQRRIADILAKADAVRRKRKEAVALTEELLRSAFLEMFGDPVANPKGWPTVTIDDVAHESGSLVDGPFGSSLKPEHYTAKGVRVIRNYNINNDYFDESEFKYVTPEKFEALRRSEVVPGDVLLTTKGTVGDVCLMPALDGPALLSASGTVRLRIPPDVGLLNEFVVSQMIQPTYKRYLHSFEAGSAQQYLNLSGIRKMRLLHPDIAAQRTFVEQKRRIRVLQSRLAVAVDQSATLFESLVQRAFHRALTPRAEQTAARVSRGARVPSDTPAALP
jgi:type I restriction enzyme S subunit